MNEKVRGQWALACMMSLFVGLGVGAVTGAVAEMSDIDVLYKEAAQHNAGRWVVDEKTGKTAWEWTGRTP